ncbi:MAG: hypothetical protein E7441_10230 [Ruminococcaceae bacterium]|nr:hypothetical protein [Oscillospiraceae bacterium]
MYILLVISSLLSVGYTALTKSFQQKTESGIRHLMMYNLINASFGCVYFLIASRFIVDVNMPTFIYAVVYAITDIAMLSFQIFALECVSVSVVAVLAMSGSILIPSLFGIAYFGEAVTVRLVISSVLIVTASVLPFIRGKAGDKRLSWKTVFICAMVFLMNGAPVVQMQLYAKDTRVCSSLSYFLLTNIMIVTVCAMMLRFAILKKSFFSQNGRREILSIYTLPQAANIGVRTAMMNIASVLQVVVLAVVPASAYAVLNSSIILIGGFLVSLFVFKEKQSLGNILAVILAIAAIVINPQAV